MAGFIQAALPLLTGGGGPQQLLGLFGSGNAPGGTPGFNPDANGFNLGNLTGNSNPLGLVLGMFTGGSGISSIFSGGR
ncbi:MAG: hypothetical protein SFZ03_05300 [Candidatus Melainabacteria bacterium]|nr:hypothetical protein [Candidatus Melainabacteria bacterium]